MKNCWPPILQEVPAGSLLIFDLGYTNFGMFARLSAAQVAWITRAKSNLAAKHSWRRTASVHDALVWIGQGEEWQLVRLIQVLYRSKWYRYLLNLTNPESP